MIKRPDVKHMSHFWSPIAVPSSLIEFRSQALKHNFFTSKSDSCEAHQLPFVKLNNWRSRWGKNEDLVEVRWGEDKESFNVCDENDDHMCTCVHLQNDIIIYNYIYIYIYIIFIFTWLAFSLWLGSWRWRWREREREIYIYIYTVYMIIIWYIESFIWYI